MKRTASERQNLVRISATPKLLCSRFHFPSFPPFTDSFIAWVSTGTRRRVLWIGIEQKDAKETKETKKIRL